MTCNDCDDMHLVDRRFAVAYQCTYKGRSAWLCPHKLSVDRDASNCPKEADKEKTPAALER